MKKVFLAIVLTVLPCLAVMAQEKGSTYLKVSDDSVIEVSETAHMDVVADRIYINITLKESDNKNSDLKTLENKMFAALKKAGADTENDLEVNDFSSEYQKVIFKGNKARLTKQYVQMVRDGETASKVLIALQKENISNVYIGKIENSRISEYKDQCSVEAIKKARDKARLLANAIGQEIGPATYISEQRYYISNAIYGAAKGIMVQDEALTEEIQVPDTDFKIPVDVSVNAKFILKYKAE